MAANNRTQKILRHKLIIYNPANLTHIHPFTHRLLGFVITFFGIIIAMNIRKIVGMEGGVSDFQLEIAPKTLLLPKGARSFALYLEKGKSWMM